MTLISIAMLLIALLLPACSIKKDGGSSAASLQNKHKECLKKTEKGLAGYGKKIKVLYAAAEEGSGNARDEINKTIKELRKKQREAVKKYDELKSASGKTWKNIQGRVKQSREDLEDTYDKALALYHEIT